MSHRRMWELLIESYCRQGSVKQALQVGWGIASAHMQVGGPAAALLLPCCC